MLKPIKRALQRSKLRQEKSHFALLSAIKMSQLQLMALSSNEPGVGNTKPERIIVSLTTIQPRINDIFVTIESLFQQILKADKIILWVSERDFPDKVLPEALVKAKNRGLEIEFVAKDLGSHTKIIYTLEKFPDDIVLTVDDDIMYPVDMIDQLYRAYKAQPEYIHCHRAHKMTLDEAGKLRDYYSWQMATPDSEASALIFPTGVAGVLYPPGSLDKEVLNRELFLDLCPNADDIWLKIMSLKKRTLCKKVADSRPWGSRFLIIPNSQAVGLKKTNKKKGGNTEKLDKVKQKFHLDRIIEDALTPKHRSNQ